jgi:cobalamin biosynthesis Mg chelatase CobN
VTGTVSWNGNVATFTPSAALAYGTAYTVTVSGKDLAGNGMRTESSFATLRDEGTISGVIRDADGNPVVNATVALSNGMSTTTDSNGHFELTGVPSGSYTLTVTKDGYRTITQTVNTSAGASTALETLSMAKIVSGSGNSDGPMWIAGVIVVIAALLIVGFLIYRRKKSEEK